MGGVSPQSESGERGELAGTGTEGDPYQISSAEELREFAELVKGGETTANAVLTDDIDLNPDMKIDEDGTVTSNPDQWTPIGTSSSNSYRGTFDGANYTISGLYIDSSANDQGLFGYVGSSGKVQNLSVSGSVSGNNYVGGVVGYNNGGTVTGCTFSGSGSVSGTNYVGGIVGQNNSGGTVTGCTFSGSGTVTGSYVGGVVGYNNGGTVTGCTFSGSGSVSGNNYVGGVVGYNNGGTVTGCTFSGSGTVTGSYVGGVVGYNSGPVENCHNTGTGTGTGTNDYVGGVVGYNTSSGNVKNCYNTGSVSGPGDRVGGVVGLNDGNVTGCYNTGSVSGSYVGGVVGLNRGSVENCYNTGTGTGTGTDDYVGGVVGYNMSSVTNCYNTGAVNSSGNYVGGVVGYNTSSGNVKNCYNTGSVSGPDSGSGNSVGGVVGYNGSSSTVENCYYQQHDPAIFGIGDTTKDDTRTVAKTAEQFASGEVAHLLEQNVADSEKPVWGQNLTGDDEKDAYPQLLVFDETTPQVYKVAFMTGEDEYHAEYANSSMTVTPPEAPEKTDHLFGGWFDNVELTGDPVTGPISVTGNATYYAQWTPVAEPDPEPTPEPEPEEPPYSGKYSYEISTNIGDNGALSVDRYATEGDTVTIQVTPDQAYKLDDLSVTAHGKEVELTANSDGTCSFTMPSADVKITATFAEDPDWTEPEPEPEPSTDVSDLFIDIAPDAWYTAAIQYAYDNGLMTGVSDTEFAPEATTTRAMIVSILARLEGVTSAEAAGFADVSDEWYATAVNWAASVGVVNGYEDNTFRPNQPITREQLAAILMNYASYKGEDVSNRADLANYTDQPSTWAEEAMQWAVAEGLISGVTNDELQPQASATRAQVAAILERFLAQ